MFASINDQTESPVRPSATITGEFAISFSQMPDRSVLLCKHEISASAVIGKGVPISFNELEQAVSAIKEERQKSKEPSVVDADPTEKFWTNNVLYHSDKMLLWYRPSTGKSEKIWFRNGDGLCLDVKMPTIVFAFNKRTGELRLFATTQKHPNRKTRLYHAPLCNVNSNGILCFGSADKPDLSGSVQNILRACESAVFDTMFGHVSHNMTFASDKRVETQDHIRLWQSFSKSDQMPKAKDMVKTSLVIEQLVGSI